VTAVRSRTVLLVRGGGWAGPNPSKTEELRDRVGPALEAAGCRVVGVDPAAGRDGLDTVLAAIDRTGAQAVWGESSGGHLGLVAAARRPELEAVVTDSAPTDLSAEEGAGCGEWPHWRAVALGLFGDDMPAWTPLSLAGTIGARVGLIHAEDDPVVPVAQAGRFAAQCPGARVLRLEPGPVRGVHGTMAADGFARSIAFGLGVLGR